MAVGRMYRDLIQTEYFRVVVVDDVEAVEVCGALKVLKCLIYCSEERNWQYL